MQPNGRAEPLAGGSVGGEGSGRTTSAFQCSPSRTSRELAITLARLQPLVESVITPGWARRHFVVIAQHLRQELAAALEVGL